VYAVSLTISAVFLTILIGGNSASSMCGKTATVSWKGKSVNVNVVDECPVCGYDNIDLSPSAFEQLADKSECRLLNIFVQSWPTVGALDAGKLEGISWKFN
jgi:expansin (peptidoglycan-binding protein)